MQAEEYKFKKCRQIMRMKPEYLPYLSGESFSASLDMTVAANSQGLNERVQYLEDMVRGKRVIHVGCLDHVPLIRQRIENNTWLHKRLTEASQTCLGIDINEEGAVLVRTLGFDNVVICNLIDDDPLPEVVGAKWDYMGLGEMLEHIDNPVLFLENIAAKYGNCVDRFLLTVPNAIHLDNFLNALRHSERINTDHRFWFTPYTLAKVANAAGMKVMNFELCLHKPNVPRRRIFYRGLLRLFPLLRGSLIMELAVPKD